jgi:nucleoside-diphosphate-sugar epimerase
MTSKVLVAGGTGYVGRFIVEGLLQAGYEVIVAGRHPPKPEMFPPEVEFRALDLGIEPAPDLFRDIDIFVHAAFDHLPGRYRGGEGDDAAGFRRRNDETSRRLFDLAKASGVGAVAFLSTRAVYGTQPPGLALAEDTEPHPDTLYGEVKLEAERDLLARRSPVFRPIVLRITGVYGQPAERADHKWAGLFADHLAGKLIAPRVATEVHGRDVASALLTVLNEPAAHGVFNVSDILLDVRDLLSVVAEVSGSRRQLPERADSCALNVMTIDRLRALGWEPGGMPLLRESVRGMLEK